MPFHAILPVLAKSSMIVNGHPAEFGYFMLLARAHHLPAELTTRLEKM
jgi:hypothetical protein